MSIGKKISFGENFFGVIWGTHSKYYDITYVKTMSFICNLIVRKYIP